MLFIRNRLKFWDKCLKCLTHIIKVLKVIIEMHSSVHIIREVIQNHFSLLLPLSVGPPSPLMVFWSLWFKIPAVSEKLKMAAPLSNWWWKQHVMDNRLNKGVLSSQLPSLLIGLEIRNVLMNNNFSIFLLLSSLNSREQAKYAPKGFLSNYFAQFH